MQLTRKLGLLHVFCIATGAMISSGLFILPGMAHAKAGPAMVVSYFLAGLLAGAGLLSIAELSSAMPKAGGDYFYISRGMGPIVGTVAGLLSWFCLSLKSAFALVGMAVLMAPIISWEGHILLAAGLGVIFVIVNLVGIKEAARLQVLLVAGLLGLMMMYVVKGLPEVKINYFEPFMPYGARAVFSTAGFVFVSYGGLLKIASMAGEVKNPGRVIPMGMILSLSVVMILYTLIIFITIGVLGAERLDNCLTPISDGAAVFTGRGGWVALSVAAALAFLTTANAGIMAASRYLLAVSRDGYLPEIIGKVGKRFKTPHISILITGAVVVFAIFLKLDILVEAASTVFILGYILSSLSVIVLRESGLQNYRPSFRSPLYPWPQLAAIFGFVFLILEMGEEAYLITVVLMAAGFCVYWFYGRKRVRSESALLHLIERITAKELVSGSLESELKEIIRERDEIEQDRFDSLIENCVVLDIEGGMEVNNFFRLIAEKLAVKVRVSRDELLNLLAAREKEGSTVLNQSLAIPHIIIEGKNRFDILLARCREGIRFSGESDRIHTVFVLVGTKDERNFHLRALSAIAQIVQEPDFAKKWMAAKNEQALRDIVLLGKRKRE